MDPLPLQTVADHAGGVLWRGDGGKLVREVSTDSRTVGAGDLFLALRGERHDGHQYVRDLPARGVAGAVVSREHPVPGDLPHDFAWIQVHDTLEAYQQLAANYRRRQLAPLKVVAITGSNGKTSTKDFTAAVLNPRFRVLKTAGNLNNHIGVPRMLLRAGAGDEIAVLEMGMNHPGEIAPLARMARPEVAIITNIGTAHLEFMGTRAAIAQEKGMLAEAVGADGCVILNAEDEWTPAIAARTPARVVTVGLGRGDLRAEDVRMDDAAGSRFTVVGADGGRAAARLPVPGLHMVANALLALAAGQALGLSLDGAVAGLAGAQLTGGRLEIKTIRGLRFLDDSYNANPDSMVAALRTLAGMPAAGRRLAVLGRMGELGAAATEGHRQVGRAAADQKVDCLIGVGAGAAGIVDAARADGLREAHLAADTDEAALLLRSLARPGDLVLLKGSRSAAMENVLRALEAAQPGAAVSESPAP